MKSVPASLSSAVLLQYNLPICLCEQLRLTLSQSCALITDSDMLVDPSVQSEENPLEKSRQLICHRMMSFIQGPLCKRGPTSDNDTVSLTGTMTITMTILVNIAKGTTDPGY